MISIIIPVYNEENSLHELHESLTSVLKDVGESYEILFINDGSTDSSSAIIKEIKNNDSAVKTVALRKNFGKSAALNVGFKKAMGDIVFTMDSDLQDDPTEIPHFLEAIESGYDLVTGWKVNRKDPKEKTIPSKLFNYIVSTLSGLKLKDYNCGFKCYRKRVTEELRLYGELHRFVPFLACKKGFKIKEIPVKHHERKYGVSKFGLERYARGFFDLLTVIFITNYLKRPMHLFGWVGSFFFFTGLAIFTYLFFGRWALGQSIGTSPLFSISILLAGIGIQIFIAGLVAELIVHNKEREDIESYSILDEDE
jgi:glycosyltransferase involved in cell wall biosynthesis